LLGDVLRAGSAGERATDVGDVEHCFTLGTGVAVDHALWRLAISSLAN
jgi:hypothetical protein